ncbi:MAG: DNA polymerase III subunit beta [Candidatus Cloacimonetes bacterium HGW-Cloacimonetes-1]|jgi:DNA polymerase-3 subunit beta|nr:MAG: DNA polymerase III subunit beta [Candidatus Cloacimonetes bacterium HGW-Cloacimonetes-1]
MRLTIEKKDLIQNIQHLATMVPSKNTSPILTNYLIDVNAETNMVQVTASDLEITVVVQFPANVTESGTIAVSARHFNEIINSMPDQMINLTKHDELLKIQCNKIDFSLMCADHTLFPVIPPRQLENAITIPADLFSRMVSKTSFAVSTDINRAVLTGVCWSIKQDHHLMVATDGRKVAEIKINDTTLKPAESVSSEDNIFNATKIENIERIIPVKSLNFLQKIFDNEVKDLSVLIDSNRIMFAYGKYTVFTHIIEHKYPDYQKAFIGDLPNTLVIEKDLLRTAIRRIALIAPDENLRIRFEVSMDQFEISTVNRDTGEAKQMMENYSYQGTATSVSFNFKYMLSILDTIDTERVKIMMGSSKDPLMIYNESTPEKQEVTFLLMPLRS